MVFIKKCPECGSIHLTYDSHLGEIICNDCGLVVEEKMVDTGIDLQSKFDKGEKRDVVEHQRAFKNSTKD